MRSFITLYSSPNIIRMITPMRWAVYVACKVRTGLHTEFLVGSHKEIDHYESLDVGERIILKRTLEKENGVEWSQYIWSRIATNNGLL
jgi:hypothetical protein